MSNRDDETTISKAEKVMDALQLIAGQVAKRVPVPQAQLMQNFLGKGGLVTSLGDLFDKIENKTAKLSDYGQVVADVLVVAGSVVVLAGGSPAILAAATAAGIATAAVKYFPEAKEWLKENFPKVGDWLDKNVPDWVAKADTKDLNSTQLAQLNSVNAESFKLAMSSFVESETKLVSNEVPSRYVPLHAQVGEQISRLYTEKGVDRANGFDNTVASCTVECVKQKVTDVQHASVGNGNIHLGQKMGYEWNVASLDAVQAARTPQQESFAQLVAFDQQLSQQQDNPTQTQTKTRSGPTMG